MRKNIVSTLFGLCIVLASPVSSAVTYGPLANFDVVNDTGKTAHGFQIEMEGIHSTDITSLFGGPNRWTGMERYDIPTVTDTATGVMVTYQSVVNGGKWKAGTPSLPAGGTLPTPHDSCWPLGTTGFVPAGGTIYDSSYPCDHFGVSASASPTKTTYRWLVETAPGATTLSTVDVGVPNPVFTVTPPPPPPANPPANYQPPAPAVNVAIAAPAPYAYEFGEPRWVKVTASGTLKNVAVEDLVADNAVIKNAKTQTQTEWQLLQTDTGNPAAGQIDLTGVALDPGATGVVYRFEFYKYTGSRSNIWPGQSGFPGQNEATSVNGDTATPDPRDLGTLIAAQNAAVNFDGNIPAAPPLPIAPAINLSIAGGVVGQPYSQLIAATPALAADTMVYDVQGTLPPGLAWNPATQLISGTPAQAGNSPITIVATDQTNGLSTTVSTSISIAWAAVQFTAVTYPTATQWSNFTYTFSATGNGALTYSIFEALPTGLKFNVDTLSGVPEVSGKFTLNVTAKDAQGFQATLPTALSIAAAPKPVAPPPPPAPVACSGTNQLLSSADQVKNLIIVNGGNAIAYTAANLVIDAPLSSATWTKLENLVTYTGTMDAAGTNCVATSVKIDQGLTWPVPVFSNATVGTLYPAVAIAPTGGVAPYTVAVSNLPSGMTFGLNQKTGAQEISGTPDTAGTFTFSISVNDNNGQTIFYSPSITIDSATCSGTNQVITFVNYQPNGKTPWIDIKGGAAQAANGGISVYVPQKGVAYTFNGGLASGTFAVGEVVSYLGKFDATGLFCNPSSMSVSPGIGFTPPSLIAANVGVNYTSAAFAATGGVNPVISVSGLPASGSLTFNGTAIVGTPKVGEQGSYPLSISITDATGRIVPSSATLVINPAPAITLGASNIPGTGQVGTAYSGSLIGTGGFGGLTWTGSGVPGLSVSSTGIVTGTPTTAGTFTLSATVTDALGQQATVSGAVVVAAAPVPAISASCTTPKGAKTTSGKTKITAIGATWIKVGTVTVDYAACTKLENNNSPKVLRIGDIAEYQGYVETNGNVFSRILTIN